MKRWLMAVLIVLVASALALAPASSVKARTDQSYFAAPPSAGSGVGWSQIKSTDDAKTFFGVTDSNHSLIYRNLINGEWAAPTEDNNNAAAVAVIGQLVGHGNKVKVQIFRGNPDVSADEYNNPSPFDYQNLTLVAGNFSETTAANSAAHTFFDPFGLGSGTGLLTLGPSTIAAAFDGVFGGNDQKAQWAFVGDGNRGVQQVMTCSDGGADKSNFVYVGAQKPIVTMLKSGDLGDKEHIADVDRIYRGNGVIGRAFDSNALSAYLCPRDQSQAGFDHLCKQKLKLQTCVSSKEDLLDALGGLFDPIQWALDKVQSVVSFFMGFVVDGLRQITDIGNLASNNGVTAAWKVMRDLANVLFILILGAIAFSTMLRIDTQRYGLRSMLPRLVAAVIGVNFSLLFVTVLVDTATVLGNPFLSGLSVLLDHNPVGNTDSLLGGLASVGASVIMLIASLVVIVVLIGVLLLLVVRIVMIWLLAAFAPLAFLFSVLPFSRSLAMQWLKQLIKWVYMAPIVYIVLWIGARFLSAADSLDAEILSILVFIGVCVAAILIPLKLGGEIMQRAAQGGKSAGKKLPGVRTAGAYLEQRRANQEQGAKLRAAAIQGGISGRLSQFPGGRAAASVLTGGRAGMIGAQQGALEKKYAGDIESLGLDTGSQRMVARGDVRGLRTAGLHDAANLARNPAGRRAAGRLLAQSGSLNRDTILGGPEAPLELNPGRSEQVAAGNQAAMKQYNPVLGNMNRQGGWSGDSLRAITAQAQSTQADGTKNVHWSDVVESLKSNNPQERVAAQRYVGNLQSGALEKNFQRDNRNYIDAESERGALAQSLVLAGHKDAAKFSPPPPKPRPPSGPGAHPGLPE